MLIQVRKINPQWLMHKQYDCSVCLYSFIRHPKQYLRHTNNMCVFVEARCALLYQKVFNVILYLKKYQILCYLVKQGGYFLSINTLSSITTYYAKLFKIPERKNGSEISIHTTDRQKLFFKNKKSFDRLC